MFILTSITCLRFGFKHLKSISFDVLNLCWVKDINNFIYLYRPIKQEWSVDTSEHTIYLFLLCVHSVCREFTSWTPFALLLRPRSPVFIILLYHRSVRAPPSTRPCRPLSQGRLVPAYPLAIDDVAKPLQRVSSFVILPTMIILRPAIILLTMYSVHIPKSDHIKW